MTIEVLNESGVDLLDVRRTQQLAAYVLDQLRVHPQAELCITAVDEDTMAELNQKWMEKDGPTDVLAFPMDELRPGKVNEEPEEGVLGDLVLCPPVAVRQAEEAARKGQVGYTAVDELDMLTVHGILHLLGYDHAEPAEHEEMFGLQARLLAQWKEDRTAQRTTPGNGQGQPDAPTDTAPR
jgi:probable rRNA maturation factor